MKDPPPKFELAVQPPMLWSYGVGDPGDSDASSQAIIYPATTPDLQKGVLPVRSPPPRPS